MKLLKRLSFAMIASLLLFSCGSSVKTDPNLSKEESEAVVKTEKSLPRGDKMVSYEVVKEKLPLAILEAEYKAYRDQAYKAQLDYRACMTRGLNEAAQKNIEILKNIQNSIVEKSQNLESQSPEYIFVLAEVKERNHRDGKLSGFIAIYDSTTLERVDLIQVTTPLYKNAVMVTQALDGKLTDPTKNNMDSNDVSSSNPVVEFILTSNPK